MRSNRQLEPPLPLNFSCRIFRHSALAPNFFFPLIQYPGISQGRYGLLGACGEATAVSVTFHPDLVAGV